MKLSIAMCTYNGARYLREQLDSIKVQSRLPDEMVICDDCSSDDTQQILAEFSDRAPFPVRLSANKQNLGTTKNFEKAITLCQGDVIFLADQDDVWHPAKLERMEAIFAERPNVGLVFTNGRIVDRDLKPEGRSFSTVWVSPDRQELVKTGRAFELLLRQNFVTGAALAFRSQFNAFAIPIPETKYYYHDGWIALVISAVADLVFVPELLIDYRHHPSQAVGVDDKAPPTRFNFPPRWEFEERRRNLETLYERLSHASFYQPGVVELLNRFNEEINHLRTRVTLPESWFHRIPVVTRILLKGEYKAHSNGWRSAIRDVFYC
jgi:glycosyltransferase involved in cell wall biosynthesis